MDVVSPALRELLTYDATNHTFTFVTLIHLWNSLGGAARLSRCDSYLVGSYGAGVGRYLARRQSWGDLGPSDATGDICLLYAPLGFMTEIGDRNTSSWQEVEIW